jgi:hypothetical protein
MFFITYINQIHLIILILISNLPNKAHNFENKNPIFFLVLNVAYGSSIISKNKRKKEN